MARNECAAGLFRGHVSVWVYCEFGGFHGDFHQVPQSVHRGEVEHRLCGEPGPAFIDRVILRATARSQHAQHGHKDRSRDACAAFSLSEITEVVNFFQQEKEEQTLHSGYQEQHDHPAQGHGAGHLRRIA
jgi:hypothetical protein